MASTKACQTHQSLWNKYIDSRSRSKLHAERRALRNANNLQAWQNISIRRSQPHDADTNEEHTSSDNYFGPNRIYVTETVVGSCGTPIAWTTFHNSESPSAIAGWINKLYPNRANRPSFIAIDKSCQVFAL